MKNENLKALFFNEKIQSVLQSARQFCDLIDAARADKYGQEDFIDLLHIRLVDLYNFSLHIPKIGEFVKYKSEERKEVKAPDRALYEKLTQILGAYTDYSKSFDPIIIESDDNYSQGWLVDDIADIYKDLNEVLELLDKNTDESVQEGLWTLRFVFGAHWGTHTINAIRFLHFVRYEKWYRHC
ncbi:MAG: DUF5063 domain-containing protein [Chitinophagales bacterium]